MIFSPLEQFDVRPIYIFSLFGIDLTLFDIFIPLFLIFIIILYYSFSLKYQKKLIPLSFQIFFELIIKFIYSTIKNNIGVEGIKYYPFIFSFFFFILIANYLSLIPYGISLTSHLIMLIWFSLSIGVAVFFLGLWWKNKAYLKLFAPTAPLLLLPFLIIIELFSYIIRCNSLAIRLVANMIAGHTLVYIVTSFILSMLFINMFLASITVLVLVCVLLLELGVCFLQAYVFTILVCIYFNEVFSEQAH